MSKRLLIATGLSAVGTGIVSYSSFLRGDPIMSAVGAFLCGASVTAFLYEAFGKGGKSDTIELRE